MQGSLLNLGSAHQVLQCRRPEAGRVREALRQRDFLALIQALAPEYHRTVSQERGVNLRYPGPAVRHFGQVEAGREALRPEAELRPVQPRGQRRQLQRGLLSGSGRRSGGGGRRGSGSGQAPADHAQPAAGGHLRIGWAGRQRTAFRGAPSSSENQAAAA